MAEPHLSVSCISHFVHMASPLRITVSAAMAEKVMEAANNAATRATSIFFHINPLTSIL